MCWISSANRFGWGVITGYDQQVAAEEYLSHPANTDSLNTEVKRIDETNPAGRQ